MSLDALFHLFTGLPRQGPGSEHSTREALRRLPELPPRPRVLDIGCGTGSQTRVLARLLDAQITAVDIHAPYLEELAREPVETRCLSMDSLDFPPETFDLIWSEGAVFVVGVSKALELWGPLLKPGGCLAFSEATWLTESPPAEAQAFWSKAYPPMENTAGNRRKIEAAGFRLLDAFPLPADDWWQEFYTPLKKRIEAVRIESREWPELAAVIEETEHEIDLFGRYHAAYGYVFYICQRGR